MNNWTPEPWKIEMHDKDDPNETGFNIVNDNGEICADDGSAWGEYKKKMSRANAARIVACVNACAGIPTECLGDDDWKTLMSGRKERDALRASLRDMVEYAERYLNNEEDKCEPGELDMTIRTDIAKAKELIK